MEISKSIGHIIYYNKNKIDPIIDLWGTLIFREFEQEIPFLLARIELYYSDSFSANLEEYL